MEAMDDILTSNILFNQTDLLARYMFGWVDYTCFILILLSSIAIGVYFGVCTKQNTSTEYFLGGKQMNYIPIAMSVIVSNLSGTSLLGVPTEVYFYGSQYSACVITAILAGLITVFIFLPVFYKLQLTSIFEYLELRFARSVRILSSLLFVIMLFVYVPVVIYAPALVFTQVTDINLHMITPLLCISCIIYTTIGGLKAVVWTDTLQIIVTVIGFLTVVSLAVASIGIGEIWRIAGEGGRLIFFDMNPSPFVRNSFWIMIAFIGTWLGHLAIHPSMMQRLLAVPTYRDANCGVLVATIGLIVIQLILVFTGLILYAKYHDCDPIEAKVVKRPDQIIPYYVMDVAGHLVGLPGLFLAGLVSSALAVMSTNLNTMSGTIYEDFVRPWLSDDTKNNEKTVVNFMKAISLICGLIAVGLVFLIERLGTVFEMGISMRSMCDGPMLGLFLLGVMVPWSNTKGAMVGGCFSLIIMSWLVGGAQWNIIHNRIVNKHLPTSVDGCPYPLNETIISTTTTTTIPTELVDDDEPMILYQISFMYFSIVGAVIVLVVGTVASYFFGVDLKSVNPDHISPVMQRFLPPREYSEVSLNELPSFDELEQSH